MSESARYEVIPSLGKGQMRYSLEGGALVIASTKTSSSRSLALADVKLVRITLIQGVGRCELHTRSGDKLVLMSRSVRGMGDFVDQRVDYGRFVAALHAALAAARPPARYLAGTSFGFSLGVIAMVAGMAGTVAAVALADRSGGDWTLLRGFSPLMGSLVMGLPLVIAGRAHPYQPESLPKAQMP